MSATENVTAPAATIDRCKPVRVNDDTFEYQCGKCSACQVIAAAKARDAALAKLGY